MRVLLFSVVFLLLAVAVCADESGYKWELLKNSDGIKVFSSETPGSDFKT